MDLVKLIQSVCRKMIRTQSFVGKVVSVNTGNDTCTVEEEEGLRLFKVRLKAIVDSTGSKVVAYPKVGSLVICSLIDNEPSRAFVSQASEIDKVVWKVGDTQLQVDASGIALTRQALSMHELMERLLTQVEALTVNVGGMQSSIPVNKAAFTAIKNDFNNLLRDAT